MLTLALVVCVASQSSGAVNVLVDAGVKGRPISPFVYGTNSPDWAGRGRYLTITRYGGNRLTAYNWENNASNAGSDWHNQNDDFLGGGDVPMGAVLPKVNDALRDGHSFIVTIPMAGYVSADKKGDGDVNQTPDYLNKRFFKSYSTAPKGTDLYGPPNTSDRVVYQDQFVGNLLRKRISSTGQVWYDLDNEPDIWAGTHSRLKTTPLTYADLLARTIDYATMLKRVDPKGLVLGPVSYGWNGFQSLQDAPDANGRYFLDFYLRGMKDAGAAAGKRLLDALDLHYYSEARGGSHRVVDDVSDADTVAARVQSPRSLYDPSYTENSWITQASTKGPINLLPRMQSLIASAYPGTKLAFTEYNFGGSDISGGVAEADALGAFGRGGVYAACLWVSQKNMGFINGAWDLYRNYDGKGGGFGDLSVDATTSDVAAVSAWASKDSKRPGTFVVLINRTSATVPVRTVLKGASATGADGYQLTSASDRPVRLASTPVSGGVLLVKLPAMSATLYVLN